MVPVSVVVSLLGGLTNQELFDLNRAMGLLPFFVIGLHLAPEHLAVLRRRGAWVAGLVGLPALWWLAAAPTTCGPPSSSTGGRPTPSSAPATRRGCGSGPG